jgi:hypothetical protein
VNSLHLVNASDSATRAVAYILAALVLIAAIEIFAAVLFIRSARKARNTVPAETPAETCIKELTPNG